MAEEGAEIGAREHCEAEQDDRDGAGDELVMEIQRVRECACDEGGGEGSNSGCAKRNDTLRQLRENVQNDVDRRGVAA
jgi:hypothetical protein